MFRRTRSGRGRYATTVVASLAVIWMSTTVVNEPARAQSGEPLSIIGYTDVESLIFMDALAFGLSRPGPSAGTGATVPLNGLRAHDWYTVTLPRASSRLCVPDSIEFNGAHLWAITDDVLDGPVAPDVAAETVSAEVNARYGCRAKPDLRQTFDTAVRDFF